MVTWLPETTNATIVQTADSGRPIRFCIAWNKSNFNDDDIWCTLNETHTRDVFRNGLLIIDHVMCYYAAGVVPGTGVWIRCQAYPGNISSPCPRPIMGTTTTTSRIEVINFYGPAYMALPEVPTITTTNTLIRLTFADYDATDDFELYACGRIYPRMPITDTLPVEEPQITPVSLERANVWPWKR